MPTRLSSTFAYPNGGLFVGKNALFVAVDRLQGRRAGEEKRVAVLGGSSQVIGSDQHFLIIFVRPLGPSRRDTGSRPAASPVGAVRQYDRHSKALRPAVTHHWCDYRPEITSKMGVAVVDRSFRRNARIVDRSLRILRLRRGDLFNGKSKPTTLARNPSSSEY